MKQMDSVKPPNNTPPTDKTSLSLSEPPGGESPRAAFFSNDFFDKDNISQEKKLVRSSSVQNEEGSFFRKIPLRRNFFLHLLRNILSTALLLVIFYFISYGSYFSWKIHAVGKTVSIENEHARNWKETMEALVIPLIKGERQTLKGEEDGRINVLLLGKAGKNNPGENLTDTIMIASADVKSKRVALISIPRDLYVPIPETKRQAKINSVYQYGLTNRVGVEPLKKTVESVTGLPIHYWAILDFSGFEKIIDDVGGITVSVERDIYDSRYPGPNYSYETFELKKGIHTLDGSTALKYVRERHSDPDGDFGRAKRQQQTMQSFKKKIFSAGTMLNVFRVSRVLDTLSDHLQTNASLEEIESFINLARELDTHNTTTAVVDAWKKDSLLRVSHIYYNDSRAFILVPRVGNFSEIQDLAANVFDLEIINQRRNSISEEKSQVTIINKSSQGDLANKISDLLRNDLGIRNVSIGSFSDLPDQSGTIIIENSEKSNLFTLDELIKKVPAAISSVKNDDIINKYPDSDLIIVLGEDIVPSYSFSESSLEELKNAPFDQRYVELPLDR